MQREQGYSSVVEHCSCMPNSLDLIPRTAKKTQKQNKTTTTTKNPKNKQTKKTKTDQIKTC
jgi:hypothetical protein